MYRGSARHEVRTYEGQHEQRGKANVHPCPLQNSKQTSQYSRGRRLTTRFRSCSFCNLYHILTKDMNLIYKFYLHQGQRLSRLRNLWSLRLMNIWLRSNTNTSYLNEQFSYSAHNQKERASSTVKQLAARPLNMEDTLSRNVGTQLPIYDA